MLTATPVWPQPEVVALWCHDIHRVPNHPCMGVQMPTVLPAAAIAAGGPQQLSTCWPTRHHVVCS
jgi:hypothetical protein